MPAKKTAPVKTSAPVMTPAPEKHPIALTKALGPKGTIAIMLAVLAGGILVTARQQSTQQETPSAIMTADETPESRTAAKKSGAAIASSASTAASPEASATMSTAAVTKAPPVTLTGCLVQADDTFRLKDTAGTGAPKTRSWKSGFLKKGSASIEVVDSAHALTLANHVGRRVSVTGTLVDREMQVRSLRRVAASCDERRGV